MADQLFSQGNLTIWTDGGARGNPGPAAIGAIVGNKKYGEKIGETTNNVAEYRALIFALKKAKQLLGKKQAKQTALEIRTDSELMYRQIRGEYKILEPDLQTLFIEVWNLKQDFKAAEFKKIPREENREADKLMNLALDGKIAAPKTEGGLL